METLTLKIDPSLMRRLEAAAAREHASRSELVRKALATYLEHSPGAAISALDRAAGLVGCFSGGPKDLASNPKHLEGFGRT